MNRLWRCYGLFYVRYMDDDFVIMAPTRHKLRRAIKEVHAVMGDLGLRLHATKRCIGQLSNGFDFLGYRVVPGRRLRTSAEGRRRFAEKFRRLYEQGADHHRLWPYKALYNSYTSRVVVVDLNNGEGAAWCRGRALAGGLGNRQNRTVFLSESRGVKQCNEQ
ncbi:MAG: reverse transcriptase domain-containing protein [Candidatus Latescibacterota bacterium]|nr:reverse transcriptase domain-containing protein [Candidatus Latescibacterota bacterium]